MRARLGDHVGGFAQAFRARPDRSRCQDCCHPDWARAQRHGLHHQGTAASAARRRGARVTNAAAWKRLSIVDREPLDIQVPASIANLGPGFDTLAVAVQLYLRLTVWTMPGHGKLEFHFVDHQLRGANHIERAFRFLARQSPISFPSLYVEVRSDIPMRAGLGSSAAATVAGLRL